ncbi:hypothetical protein TELCIR_12369 [Teladorsagia circumcincta]|uniref:Protein kinase domain-containing protein n=1 Tax=Teladorsagia circumcincta TaxID=45464 RepID=A0A2G9U6Z0_TELCI|nr:hypothetical protein TELCIR_12369 [Teladorsagia circumcincta]
MFPNIIKLNEGRPHAIKLSKGKVIGKRWRILKRIGEGGFGAVYKVEDVETHDLAALKAEWDRGPRSVLRLEAMVVCFYNCKCSSPIRFFDDLKENPILHSFFKPARRPRTRTL